MTAVWASVFGLALLVLLLGLLVVGLLKSHAELIRRLDSLGVRLDDDQHGLQPVAMSPTRGPTSLEAISGVSPQGEPIVVSPTSGSVPLLIAFLSTSCSSCSLFWEWIDGATMAIDHLRYRVLIVTLGVDEESPTRAASLRRGSADVVMSSAGWSAYGVPGAPYFVAVDPIKSEVVGEGTAQTVAALEGFLRDSTGDRTWDPTDSPSDRTDKDRETRIDEELRRAGIYPDDPRLYPGQANEQESDV